jgi:uncharacterized protein (TIGR02284 family)
MDRTSRAVLNTLIETCRDSERGLNGAAGLVTAPSLKELFLEFAAQRARFAEELVPHAQRLGGAATADGTAAASVHRRWMDLKSALTSHDDHAIVTEVRRGDNHTLRTYREAVEGFLPEAVRELVERQESELRVAHAQIEESARKQGTQTVI